MASGWKGAVEFSVFYEYHLFVRRNCNDGVGVEVYTRVKFDEGIMLMLAFNRLHYVAAATCKVCVFWVFAEKSHVLMVLDG